MFIGGTWQQSLSGEVFDAESPATGEKKPLNGHETMNERLTLGAGR